MNSEELKEISSLVDENKAMKEEIEILKAALDCKGFTITDDDNDVICDVDFAENNVICKRGYTIDFTKGV